MSMKPWERDIIEYRPNIGLNREILSVVISQDRIAQFQPSAVVNKVTTMLGIDMMESVIASLSRGVQLLNQVEKALEGDPDFTAYQAAVADEDEALAQDIYLDYLANINGKPEFDVYPMLEESVEEMEIYLDYLNQELFDGEANYSDLTPVREKEEQQIISLLDIESEDLRLIKRDELSPEQLNLIQRMIDDESHPLSSVDEYVQYINADIKEEGSPRINYEEWSERIQFIATAYEKTQMQKGLLDQIDSHLQTLLSSHLYDDLQGSLEYLLDVEDSLADMREGLKTSFDYHAKEAQESYINSVRVSNRNVREFLDRELSAVKAKKSTLIQRLEKVYNPDKYGQLGAQTLMQSVSDSIHAIEALWKYVLTEHIGTSEMNADQNKKFFEFLSGKQKNQSLYHYVDLVDREFDRENKELELNRFISIHGLHKRR